MGDETQPTLHNLFTAPDWVQEGGKMSEEAFEKWAQGKSLLINIREEMMYTAGYINITSITRDAFCAGWQAALQHSGEPVAWMSPNKQSLEFSRPDTVYGSHTIPLYTTPQPVVPPQWRVVMRGMVEYAECNDPGNPYLDQAKALLSAGKEDV
jgi:hypothetical protein